LKDAEEGRVLAHCHAGCEQETVIKALRARGLWPEQNSQPKRVVAEIYDYKDESGEVLYQVVRFAAARKLGRNRARDFLNDGVSSGTIRCQPGPQNAKQYFLVVPEGEV
jgi:hypothetical protein